MGPPRVCVRAVWAVGDELTALPSPRPAPLALLRRLVEAERLCRLGLKLSERLMVGTVAHYQEGGEEMPGVDMTVADVMAAYNALAGVLQVRHPARACMIPECVPLRGL